MSKTRKIILGVIAFLAISGIYQKSQDYAQNAKLTPGERAMKAKAVELDAAKSACHRFVKDALHDPGSAEFLGDVFMSKDDQAGVFEIVVNLRAKNAMNAQRKTAMTCKTKQISGEWIAVSVAETQ